ncbi:uncharacterized protein LOC105850885 [Hydra vulgaris]|uniref:uncharacterized protein LOC105850885 n=1 Tax=Hydra vulgaris TaxID=6087 RepID=UPI0032E9D888
MALPKKHTRTLSPVLEVKKSYNKKESSTNVNLDRKHFREENLPVFISSSSFLSSSMQKIKYTNSKQDKDKKAAHPHTTHPALIVSPSSGGTNREELLETSPLSCSASKSRSSRKTSLITFADGGAGFKEMTNKQFQYVMLMKLEQLEDNQIQITNSLASLVNGGNGDASVVVEDMQPMLSIEEFDIEEIKLQNKTYRDKKKIAIKTLGGKDLRASVRLALDALMAREVQNLFSKDGISGKKAFSKTMHYRCLLVEMDFKLIQEIELQNQNWKTAQRTVLNDFLKGYSAINCQIVVDPDGQFRDVVIKFSGSCYDSLIYSNSTLKQTLEVDPASGFLFGDSGYGLSHVVITPFNPLLNPEKIFYNKIHSRVQSEIERSFGRLKNR